MRRSVLFILFALALTRPLTAKVIYHTFPRICPRSEQFNVRVEAKETSVYHTSAGNFVSFESDEPVSVQVLCSEPPQGVRILPLRLGIEPVIESSSIRFELPQGEKVLVEIDNMQQLFVYSNDIQPRPDPDTPGLRFYKSGQVYEVGKLKLEDNEQVYIEGGAVVRGTIRATSAKNITISGYGVVDGGYYSHYGEHSHFIRLQDCVNASVEDIIMIEPPGWMLVLYHSSDVSIDNIKQLGSGHGSDGIDIVASHKVRINNCMLRNGDDCIVVKSFTRDRYSVPILNTHSGVDDVLVTNCSVQSNGGGQAFEIGHELVDNPVTHIRYIDCDVLGVHGQGGVFGIHNCDGAMVSDVLYQDIRVDHYYNKLIDMRIVKSRWSRMPERGHVENVVMQDIHVTNTIYNPGYSISLIGGYDAEHKIKNVTIENFYINGEKIINADDLDLYIKQAEDVVIQ
ncbi:MAG: glycosyl hydrolase family 28 protein [candidate division KSB1 bacterium]|nr:glycosyl hydrolase family 28 protein [candidate division KSB1 bacterium]